MQRDDVADLEDVLGMADVLTILDGRLARHEHVIGEFQAVLNVLAEKYLALDRATHAITVASNRELFGPHGDEPNSHNHHFWGDVSAWMIENLAGIQVNPYLSDPNELLICPRIIDALDHAEGYTEIPAEDLFGGDEAFEET